MYRNDPILPTFALILAAGLFYAAYLDGQHIARLLGHVPEELSVGQIGLMAFGAVLLLYGLMGTMYSFNIVYMMFGHGAGYPGEWGDLLMTNLFRNTFGMWNFGLGAAASTLYMLLSLGLILFWYRVFREDLRAR